MTPIWRLPECCRPTGVTRSTFAWRRWTFRWDARAPGEYELCARATDVEGNTQPLDQAWNLEGVQNNAVQRVRVLVGRADATQVPADSR